MMRRKVRNVRGDKKFFSRSADRVQSKNLMRGNPMRGGIRL